MVIQDKQRPEVFAERGIGFRSTGLHICFKDGEKNRALVASSEEVNENVIQEPFVRLSDSAVQQLMDQLWMVGFRPSKGVSSAGQQESTVGHLEDMRTIVSAVLKIDLPGVRHE